MRALHGLGRAACRDAASRPLTRPICCRHGPITKGTALTTQPSPSATLPDRPFWNIRLVRARDVQERDVIRLDGRWREVMDVYNNGYDPALQFGRDSAIAHEIQAVLDRADDVWTALRFVAEEKCSGAEIETQIVGVLWCSLLEVQVEEHSSR